MNKKDMKYMVSIFIMTVCLMFSMHSHSIAKQLQTSTIIVTVGSCVCGNHMASFESNYNGKKIEVALYYGGETLLIKGNTIYKDWYRVFCPAPGNDNGPLSGKKVKLVGKWEGINDGVRSFSAKKIYVIE